MLAILKTNSAKNHPAENWAHATATHVLPLADAISEQRKVIALELQARIASTLAPFFDSVMASEADKLANDMSYIATPHDAREKANEAIEAIQAVAHGTPWDNMLRSKEWAESIYDTVLGHFQTAQHVERLLFADRNPDFQHTQSYKAAFNLKS